MYKIAVIGDRESVLGFMALGFSVFPVTEREEAERTINSLTREDYAVIYITESVMQKVQDTIDLYRDATLPAIIPIPDKEGSLGLGMHNVKRSVERAVGADILFREE
ncbi:MAG: V-type ATP synthase subunit F [Peptococcia bacterium]